MVSGFVSFSNTSNGMINLPELNWFTNLNMSETCGHLGMIPLNHHEVATSRREVTIINPDIPTISHENPYFATTFLAKTNLCQLNHPCIQINTKDQKKTARWPTAIHTMMLQIVPKQILIANTKIYGMNWYISVYVTSIHISIYLSFYLSANQHGKRRKAFKYIKISRVADYHGSAECIYCIMDI